MRLSASDRAQKVGIAVAAGLTTAAGIAYLISLQKDRRRTRLNPVTASFIDIRKYAGRWFELARFPQAFERGYTDVQALYTLMNDGRLKVENYGVVDGRAKVSTGVARVVDPYTNSKLRVQFFWPLEGNYWILGVGLRYEWAVVGDPEGERLWILGRTTRLPKAQMEDALQLAQERGFDITRLIQTPHSAESQQKVERKKH